MFRRTSNNSEKRVRPKRRYESVSSSRLRVRSPGELGDLLLMIERVTHAGRLGQEIERHLFFVIIHGCESKIRVAEMMGITLNSKFDREQPQNRLGKLDVLPDQIEDVARIE